MAPFLQIAGSLAGLEKILAYLDPGSGSFILQVLVASLLAGMLFIKTFWRRITSIFHKTDSSVEEPFSKDDDNRHGQ